MTTEPESEPNPAKRTREVLVNPFRVGDKVTLPAGTPYRTKDPELKGQQRTAHKQTVTVEQAVPGFIVRKPTGEVQSRLPRIRTSGSGKYKKNISITNDIIMANKQLF